MKKFLLLTMFACTVQLAKAQDLKKVQTNYIINRMEDAKTEIDKVMADPKQQSKLDAIFWKSKVYAAIYKDAKLQSKYPNALADAEAAFDKYLQADPSFAKVKELGAEGFFDMYATAYAAGVKVFNDKKWDEAALYFKTAVTYSDFIFKNKWSNVSFAFDTTSLLFLSYSFQNASKPAEAAKYYSRLADARVKGDAYLDIYKFLANYYTQTKNEADFKKYIGIGRELYPDFTWDEFEIDYMDQNLTLAEKTSLYDKEDAAGTLSEIKYLQFGDIFVNAHHKDKSLDSLAEDLYNHKAAEAFKKAYLKNKQNGIAAFNVGVIYYNFYGELDDKYAANIRTMQGLNADKPIIKDPKKKATAEAEFKLKIDPLKKANTELEKPMADNLDIAIEWLENSFNILKNKATKSHTEKSVVNKTVDFLANLYAYKRDKVRGKDAKAFDAFEAKYKEYDALHAKY